METGVINNQIVEMCITMKKIFQKQCKHNSCHTENEIF